MTDYNKWDKLDLDDDEDVSDCHPNIDGKLWLRLKKEKQWRKWQEEDEVAAAFPMQQAALVTKMEGLEAEIARRDEAGFGGNVDALREQIAGVAGEMEALKTKQDKYEDRKQWRSSEVSVEDEEFAVKTPEQVALEKQDDIRRSRIGRDERIAKAVAAKAAGTALFKAKKWAEASEAYADGFDYVRMFDDPEDMATASEIRLSLALNLSAACHKTGEFGRAVGYASKALEVDQDNAKALYRRGQARIGTRDYAAAKADLMRAAKLAPKDKAINKAAKEAKALLTKSQAPLTDDEKADQYLQAAKDNEAIFREFAYLRSDDASEEYINAHSELLTEHATGWMLLHCLELEMKGNTAEMRKVARQNEILEYITRSCREVKIVDDPRAATMPFFRSMKADDPRAREGFESDMNGVIDKIIARAKVKKQEQLLRADEPEEDELIVEKIEIEIEGVPTEFLVDKKQGYVFKDDGKGTLAHVGQWENTEVEGEGRVHLGQPDPSKDLQIAPTAQQEEPPPISDGEGE